MLWNFKGDKTIVIDKREKYQDTRMNQQPKLRKSEQLLIGSLCWWQWKGMERHGNTEGATALAGRPQGKCVRAHALVHMPSRILIFL